MKIKEAIDIMCRKHIRCEDNTLRDAYKKAIIALEKENPMEPYQAEGVGIDGVPDDLCPSCGNPVSFIGRKISYCPRCGQALLW